MESNELVSLFGPKCEFLQERESSSFLHSWQTQNFLSIILQHDLLVSVSKLILWSCRLQISNAFILLLSQLPHGCIYIWVYITFLAISTTNIIASNEFQLEIFAECKLMTGWCVLQCWINSDKFIMRALPSRKEKLRLY